jgi:hypothetical protein
MLTVCDPWPGKTKAVVFGSRGVIAYKRKRAVEFTARRVHFVFLADNLAAFVMTAVRADGVRQAHLAAIAALHQVARFQRIVGAPAITATGSVFSLRMGWHGLTPVSCSIKAALAAFHNNTCPSGRLKDYTYVCGFCQGVHRNYFGILSSTQVDWK